MKRTLVVPGALALLTFLSLSFLSAGKAPDGLSPMEELGKRLFFDNDLSTPAGQACATCHGRDVGFTGPDEDLNKAGAVYEGAVKGRFGSRKPSAAAYAGASPRFHLGEGGTFVGGMFWDGRATGDSLNDPLAEQALGPFLDPLEQNMPDKKSIILAVKRSDYAALFEKAWGPGSLDAEKDIDGTYIKIGRAVAAYERSAEVSPFNSKFDDFWRAAKAKDLDVDMINEDNLRAYQNLGLDMNELNGLWVFASKGMCSRCHSLSSENGAPPLFTDFTYDNMGVPRNPKNPFYKQDKTYNPDGAGWLDKGLGGHLGTREKDKSFAAANIGKHKVPTLRNVDLRPGPGFVKCYMHNGCFKSLKEVVHFYNTRDVDGAGWPPPEIADNINYEESGNLGLTDAEENEIITFLRTLSDRPQETGF